jgi:hypothetical protein
MRLRTFIGCLVCAVIVVSAGALRLAPTVEAQTYPIVRTTAASGRFTAVGTNTLSTTAEVLATSAVTWECLVQNDPDNTVDFLVGSATTQNIQLSPGQSITLPVQDVSLIWADAVSGTPVANYLCR